MLILLLSSSVLAWPYERDPYSNGSFESLTNFAGFSLGYYEMDCHSSLWGSKYAPPKDHMVFSFYFNISLTRCRHVAIRRFHLRTEGARLVPCSLSLGRALRIRALRASPSSDSVRRSILSRWSPRFWCSDKDSQKTVLPISQRRWSNLARTPIWQAQIHRHLTNTW